MNGKKLALAIAAAFIAAPLYAKGPGGHAGSMAVGKEEHQAQGELAHKGQGKVAQQLNHRAKLKPKKVKVAPIAQAQPLPTPDLLRSPTRSDVPRPPAPADLPRLPSPPRPPTPGLL